MKIGKVSGRMIISMAMALCMMLQMLITNGLPVSASVQNVCWDDFTDGNYTVNAVPPSITGWYGDFASSVPSGAVSTAVVKSTDSLPSGRVVENKSNGTNANLVMTRALPAGLALNQDKDYYVKWNVFIAADAPVNSSVHIKLFSSSSSNTASITNGGTVGFSLTSQRAADGVVVYNPNIMYGGANKGPFNQFTFNAGNMYTVVGHVRAYAASTANDHFDIKVYKYGKDEPGFQGSYDQLNATAGLTNMALYTNGFNAGQVQIGDIQFSAYDGGDMINASAVFDDSSALHADFNNLNAAGSLESVISYTGASNVSWVSSDSSLIEIQNGIPNVLRQPADADKHLFLTATLANGNAVTKKSFPVTILKRVAHPPVAENVTITSAQNNVVSVNQPATGSYTLVNPDDHSPYTGDQSTYQWYYCDAAGNIAEPIDGATSITYTPADSDAGRDIVFRVTPIVPNPDGGAPLTGVPEMSSVKHVFSDLNPAAKNVRITLSGVYGEVLTGSYGYEDPLGLSEEQSVYRWYYYDAAATAGQNYEEITGSAGQKTYTVKQEDIGRDIVFEVKPRNTQGREGDAIKSAAVRVTVNPVVGNLNIAQERTGTTSIKVTAQYQFGDFLGSPDASGYQWEIADTANGNFTPVAGAVEKSYIPSLAEDGKFIKVTVTPKAGNRTGTAVTSEAVQMLVKQVQDIIIDDQDTANPDGTVQTYGVSVKTDASKNYNAYKNKDTITYAGSANAYVIYTPNIKQNGIYNVYSWFPSAGGSTYSTTFIVGSNAKSSSVALTQNSSTEGKWNLIGTYNFYTRDTTQDVITIKQTAGATSTRFDAVKLEYAGEATLDALDVRITGTGNVGDILTGSYSLTISRSDLSTYQWSSADNPDGPYIPIRDANQKNYTPVPADVGKYVKFEVTPRIAGAAADYVSSNYIRISGQGSSTGIPAAPVARDVRVEGNPRVGNTLTGKYIFEDSNGDAESVSGSIYRWYRGNAASAVFEQVYTGLSYIPSEADLNKYFYFEVTPTADVTPLEGNPVKSDIFIIRGNESGIEARNIGIDGVGKPNQTLLGKYDYYSLYGDSEQSSTYRWLISGSKSGNYAPIPGATAIAYISTESDAGKYIKFEVVPGNSMEEKGAAVQSNAIYIADTKEKVSISGGGGSHGGGTGGVGNTVLPPITQVSDPTNNSVHFLDIQDHWAKDAIDDLNKKGFVKGVDDEHFEPERAITRAEFVSLVGRAMGLQSVNYNEGFKDVAAQEWYAGMLQAAKESGMVTGSDGYFYPDAYINREEMTKIMVEAYKKLNGQVEEGEIIQFQDAEQISPWAKSAVAVAVKAGLIMGMDNNRFMPFENATRAQAAVMIKRLLGNAKK